MKIHRYDLLIAALSAGLASAACTEKAQHSIDQVAALPAKVEAVVFDELDKDQNGYINAIEATEDSTLMEEWISLDANSDRKIDRSEFAKLEANRNRHGAIDPSALNSSGGKESTEQDLSKPQNPEARY